MILSTFVFVTPEEWLDREKVYAMATEAIEREYRRESGSRRQVSIWGWQTDGWLTDGSGVNLHSMLVGRPSRFETGLENGYPVLAECWAYIREKKP